MSNTITEQKHEKNRQKFKIIGAILLVVGAILTILGLISFFTSIGKGFPRFFFLAFIGIPLLGIGAALTRLAYMKQVSSYVASQTAPITKDTINYIVDGTKDNIANVASSVINTTNKDNKIECPKCHTLNDEFAKYCDNCGTALNKICPNCQKKNDINAKYCDACGAKLD